MIAFIWLFLLTTTFVFVNCLHKKKLRFYKNKYDVVLTMPSFFLVAGAVFAYISVIASIYFYFENEVLYLVFLIFSFLFSVVLFSYYSCYAFCNKNEIVKTTWFFRSRKIDFSTCDGYYLEDDIVIFAGCTKIYISRSMKNYHKLTELLYSRLPELKKETCNNVKVRKFKDSVYDFSTYVFLLILDLFLLGMCVFFLIVAPNVRGIMIFFSCFMLLMPILFYISITRAHTSAFWDRIARIMVNGEALKPFTPTIESLAEQLERYTVAEVLFCGKPYKIAKESQVYNIIEVTEDAENSIFSGTLDGVLNYVFTEGKSLSNSFCSCKILHIY